MDKDKGVEWREMIMEIEWSHDCNKCDNDEKQRKRKYNI